MTPEAKAKAAATRQRNAERKAARYAEYLKHDAVLTKAARLKLKLEALANDLRGEPNTRAIAAAKLAKLPPPPPRSGLAHEPPPLPRTMAEWRMWRCIKPKRQARRRAHGSRNLIPAKPDGRTAFGAYKETTR
jgi:hypothetical protein